MKKMYRLVSYDYNYSAEKDEFTHLGVDPWELDTTPISSFGEREEAEALLKKLQKRYPEAKLGLQASFVGECRLAAGAKALLKDEGRVWGIKEMDFFEGIPQSPDECGYDEDDEDEDDEDEYEDDEYEDDECEDDECEDDEY